MELRHLRYFQVVAEELHFARAAERLHLAQQPLSFQIKQLEDELGVKLFQRTTRRVRLTNAGEVFLREIQPLFPLLDRSIAQARRAEQGYSGELVIAYANTSLYHLMPRAVRRFRDLYPDVQVTLKEARYCDMEDALLRNEVDLGFIIPTFNSVHIDVITHLVHQEPVVVAMPAGHPLEAYDQVPLVALKREPWLMYDKGYVQQLIFHACNQVGYIPNVVYSGHSEQEILGLVAAGMGISLMQHCLSSLRADEVSFRPLIEPAAVVDWALVHSASNTSPLIQHFLDVAQEFATQSTSLSALRVGA